MLHIKKNPRKKIIGKNPSTTLLIDKTQYDNDKQILGKTGDVDKKNTWY